MRHADRVGQVPDRAGTDGRQGPDDRQRHLRAVALDALDTVAGTAPRVVGAATALLASYVTGAAIDVGGGR